MVLPVTPSFDLEELKSTLSYDPFTGHFVWLVDVARNIKAGTDAAKSGKNPYLRITIKKKTYFAHKVAFFYMTGRWPGEVDHKNTNKKDNSWENLRECSRPENQYNRGFQRNNTSGIKGVSWHKHWKKWRVTINVRGKTHCLGYFHDVSAAASVYAAAAERFHGEFARLSLSDSPCSIAKQASAT